MFIAVLIINSLIIFTVSYYILNKQLYKRRIAQKLQINAKKAKVNKIKEARKLIKNPPVHNEDGFMNKIKNWLSDSGINMRATSFIGIFISILAALFIIGIYVSKNLLLPLVIIIIQTKLTDMLLKFLKNRRLKKVSSQLLDMILTLSSNLKSGYSLTQGLNVIAEEGHEPLASEIGLFIRDIGIGITYEDACDKLVKRNPIEELEILVTGILINRETGGSLSKIMDNISETIRERERIQGEIRSLTAQGRLSGVILSLMPVCLAAFLYIMNPSYMGTLFSNPIGILMVILGISGEVTGALIIRKITKIDW